MARYFRISISNTNLNGPFYVFYNTSNGGVLSLAALYPSGLPASDLSKILFTGGSTVSVETPNNVFSIQVVQESPYTVSNIFEPTPLTPSPTTAAPTPNPTTASPTTAAPTTAAPTTAAPTTASPTTASPTTASPTTASPTTTAPTTAAPTTASPTPQPTTASPTTTAPTTASPTTAAPTTAAPTTAAPTTASPTTQPTTASPTTASPTTASPTTQPTTASPTTASPTTTSPTTQPTTASPTTASPTTASPTTQPTTASPTTASPTTQPTTASPTTASPTTASPTTSPTTASPTTASPTTAPTTAAPTTASPTTAPTTASPTTAAPTTASPTTASPTTAAPTTAAPTGTPATVNIHLEEYNASPTTFLDANLTVNGTTYYFSGDFSASVPAGTSNNVTLEAAEATPSNIWGPFKTGSANLLIYENGTLIHNIINNYYSGSGSQNFSQAITYGAGKAYVISGSTLPIDVPEVCYNCGEGFTLTTGSLVSGEYPAVDICSLDDETAIRVNYNVYTRPNRVNIYNNNGFFTSSAWAGEAAYAGPWGSSLNTSPDGNIYFTYSAAYAPYSIYVEYGNADPISPVEDDVSISVYCTPPTGSFDFLRLFPTSSVIPAFATASCSNDPYFNLAGLYFTASYGSPYGYSASFAQDANGNPIWIPSGSGDGVYFEIDPIIGTWAWLQNVPTQSVYYPAISDGINIVSLQPIYDCVPLDATFVIAPLTNTATGTIYYPALPVSGSQSRGTSYRVTGSLNTLVSVSAVATNGSTFRGWSFTSGSTAGIFKTDSTIQIPLTTTGSIFYAIIDKNIISASFCYYNSDPIGTVACDACAVTSSVYFNAYALTGSNYAGTNWYSDANLTTLVPTGYYKLTDVETSTPIYYVSGNPVQTRTANGYCSDVTLTC
jgi:hypothetical protein